MIDNKREINLKIDYDIKLFSLDWIHYMTSYMTDYGIIRFYNIIIALIF